MNEKEFNALLNFDSVVPMTKVGTDQNSNPYFYANNGIFVKKTCVGISKDDASLVEFKHRVSSGSSFEKDSRVHFRNPDARDREHLLDYSNVLFDAFEISKLPVSNVKNNGVPRITVIPALGLVKFQVPNGYGDYVPCRFYYSEDSNAVFCRGDFESLGDEMTSEPSKYYGNDRKAGFSVVRDIFVSAMDLYDEELDSRRKTSKASSNGYCRSMIFREYSKNLTGRKEVH